MKFILFSLLLINVLSLNNLLSDSKSCPIPTGRVDFFDESKLVVDFSSPKSYIKYDSDDQGKINFSYFYSEKDAAKKYTQLITSNHATFDIKSNTLSFNFTSNESKLVYESREESGDTYIISVHDKYILIFSTNKEASEEREDLYDVLTSLHN